jgi:hypothetical protein
MAVTFTIFMGRFPAQLTALRSGIARAVNRAMESQSQRLFGRTRIRTATVNHARLAPVVSFVVKEVREAWHGRILGITVSLRSVGRFGAKHSRQIVLANFGVHRLSRPCGRNGKASCDA